MKKKPDIEKDLMLFFLYIYIFTAQINMDIIFFLLIIVY